MSEAKVNRMKRLSMLFGVLSALLIGGVIVYFVSRTTASRSAEESATSVLEHLEQQLPYERSTYTGDSAAEMPTVLIGTESFLGIVELPSLDLKLPVLARYSEDARPDFPGRVEGSAYSSSLVLLGSNLVSVFGRIGDMPDGSEVIFTDVDGHEFFFRVATAETMEVEHAERFVQAANPWDLVLLTEQFSGENYLAILCTAEVGE